MEISSNLRGQTNISTSILPHNFSITIWKDCTWILHHHLFQIEEASAEEEELLGKSSGGGGGGDLEDGEEGEEGTAIARDEELLRVLDRMIFYLRMVHSIDFYNHSEYPNEDEMPNRSAFKRAFCSKFPRIEYFLAVPLFRRHAAGLKHDIQAILFMGFF